MIYLCIVLGLFYGCFRAVCGGLCVPVHSCLSSAKMWLFVAVCGMMIYALVPALLMIAYSYRQTIAEPWAECASVSEAKQSDSRAQSEAQSVSEAERSESGSACASGSASEAETHAKTETPKGNGNYTKNHTLVHTHFIFQHPDTPIKKSDFSTKKACIFTMDIVKYHCRILLFIDYRKETKTMNRTVENSSLPTFRDIRKNAYRDKYEWLLMWEKLLAENPSDDADIMAKRKTHMDEMKREIRCMNRTHIDRFRVPAYVPNAHRYVTPYDDEPEAVEYWYEEDDGSSDEEIDEAVESLRIECRGCYGNPDGAGMPFTYRLSWKRTPYGIRIIHGTSLNI